MCVVMMVLMAVCMCVCVAIVRAVAMLAQVVIRVGRVGAVGVLCIGVIVRRRMRMVLLMAVCGCVVMTVVVARAVRLGGFGFSNHLCTGAASMPAAQTDSRRTSSSACHDMCMCFFTKSTEAAKS